MNNQIQIVLKSSTTEMSLNDHEVGIYIIPDLDGLTGLPEIRTTSGVNAGYDGGWTTAQNYDARSITLRGVIANSDVATVERLRKQLVTLLGQGKNEQLSFDIVTQAGNAYELMVRTIDCEMAMQRVLTQQEFMIQLRADDPLIYDNTAGSESVLVQVQRAIGGFEIDFGLPLAISGGSGESVIENSGLEKVYPVIKMYGELHNPIFVNLTTNQQIQVDATLGYAEGEWSTPSDVYEGKTITIDDAPSEAPLASFQLDGETSQNGTPTPDAPVAVQTVTGDNAVKIWGTKYPLNIYRQGSWSDIEIANRIFTADCAFVKAGTTYTISTNMDMSSFKFGVNIRSVPFDNTGSPSLSYDSGWKTDSSFSFTPQIDGYCGVVIAYSNGTTNLSPDTISGTHFQIEIGATATNYDDSQVQKYEVNLGKNLLDQTTLVDGYVNFDTSFNIAHQYGEKRSDFIKVEPNTTYTFSIQATSSTYDNWFGIGEYRTKDVSSGIQRATQNIADRTSFTFKTPANCYYVVLSARNLAAATKVQFEKSLSQTEYAPYFEPIELCKIGTYQDYIWNDNGTWKKHKAVDKMALSSLTSWGRSEDGKFFASSFASNYGVVAGDGYSDQFDYSGTAWSADYRFGVTGTGNLWIATGDSTLTSTDLFNTWLQNHNPVAYFQLATPTDTEITNQALITQLDNVASAPLYTGVNNITTITPNEQGTLEISYMTEKGQDRRDAIVIDSRMRTVTLNGADIYHLIAEGSEFPLLAPGENKLVLHSDITGDNGYADVNYKQGYLSI